jgi:hypothetical protein
MHQDSDTVDHVSQLQQNVLTRQPAIITERVDIAADRFVNAADVLGDCAQAAARLLLLQIQVVIAAVAAECVLRPPGVDPAAAVGVVRRDRGIVADAWFYGNAY